MSISAQMVYTLSNETGFSADLCKIALEQTQHFAKAKELIERWTNKTLEEPNQVYSKVSGFFDQKSQAGLLVKLTCNKFVLIDDEIKSIFNSVVNEVFSTGQIKLTSNDISKIEKERNCKITIEYLKIGKSSPLSLITIYNHRNKISSLVETEVSSQEAFESEDFRFFSFDCAMHVAAFNPIAIHIDNVDKKIKSDYIAFVEKEFYREHKPMAHWGVAGESRFQKWAAKRSLLTQIFVHSNDKTVDDVRKQISDRVGSLINIKRFARLEV